MPIYIDPTSQAAQNLRLLATGNLNAATAVGSMPTSAEIARVSAITGGYQTGPIPTQGYYQFPAASYSAVPASQKASPPSRPAVHTAPPEHHSDDSPLDNVPVYGGFPVSDDQFSADQPESAESIINPADYNTDDSFGDLASLSNSLPSVVPPEQLQVSPDESVPDAPPDVVDYSAEQSSGQGLNTFWSGLAGVVPSLLSGGSGTASALGLVLPDLISILS